MRHCVNRVPKEKEDAWMAETVGEQAVAGTAQAAPIPGLTAIVQAAADAADDVDRNSRFPIEAIEAIRQANLLSCSLPKEFGGGAFSISQLATVARALGAACSSAAMVFAMHHTQALSLTRYGHTGPLAELTSRIAADEALLASATTEATTGGDIRSSTCALVEDRDEVILEKNAPVISYGEHADYIFATARRTLDSPASDQILLACPAADTVLERTSSWDVMGFRGTCSPGYVLKVRTSASHVLPNSYAEILDTTMLPASHTLWAAVWLGIADAALSKARTATREAVRRARGDTTPQAAKLVELTLVHQNFETVVAAGIRTYEEFRQTGASESSMAFTIAMNNLKLTASTAIVDVVVGALQLIGLNGYRNDHPASMDRLLRDSFAPQLMVSNDRIRANNAQLVAAQRGLKGFR
jgi:acyl-CoA dehydrogenase